MLVNEIVVTRSHVIAFAYDAKNNRPFTTSRITKDDIARVSDDYATFVKLEMRSGVTHWVEIFDGKKREFIASLKIE